MTKNVGRPRRQKDVASIILSLRLTKAEKTKLDKHIATMERASGLTPGSITPTAFLRSCMLDRLSEGP